MRAYAVVVDEGHHVLTTLDERYLACVLFQRKADAERWMAEKRMERPSFQVKRVNVEFK
jgi:hypothetical protein